MYDKGVMREQLH